MFKQGLEPLKSSTFEEIPSEKVVEVLNGKTLGYSKIKFIPKEIGGVLNLRARNGWLHVDYWIF
jgi:hypothetical protein